MTDTNTPAPDMGTPEGIAQTQVNTLLANPAQIPAKFKAEDGTVNVDALTASYLELERLRSGAAPAEATPAAASPAPNAADALTAATEEKPAESLAEALAEPVAPAPNEMWATINAEFASTGTISDASAKLLIDSGADPAILATFNVGREAKAKQDMEIAANLVGGADELNATIAWAKENMSKEEREAVIPLLNGPTAATVLMGIHQRRLAAAPADSGQVNTGDIAGESTLPPGNPHSQLVPFRDWNEQRAAMSDPRYQTDPAYREECEARLILGAGYSIQR